MIRRALRWLGQKIWPGRQEEPIPRYGGHWPVMGPDYDSKSDAERDIEKGRYPPTHM